MRKALVFLVMMPLLLATPGCWDMRDVNDTAFAVSMALDVPDHPDRAKYKVTLEFAEPVPGRPTPNSLTASAEGSSILQAVQKIGTTVSRDVSFSHLRVLIVGEELARERNFQDIANYLQKEPQVALRLSLFFVQNAEAKAVVEVKPKYRELVASELVEMGRLRQNLALIRIKHFFNFWSDLQDGGGTALGTRIVLGNDRKSILGEGAAVFENWRLKAWLGIEDILAANWLVDKPNTVVVARDGARFFTCQVSGFRTRIASVMSSGQPGFRVNVSVRGMVMEETGATLDFTKEENLRMMETLFAGTIKKQVESAVAKAQQELRTDYLGFGKVLKQQQPKVFASLDWPAVFPQVPVQVEVVCRVTSSGLET